MQKYKINKIINNLSLQELEQTYYSITNYDSFPVSINEFISNPYYLGLSFLDNNESGKGIYPYWVDVLKQIYPSPIYSPYWLIALRGSIGIGKTTIASVITAYEIYLLLCLKSPQLHFNLMPDTRIVVSVFNIILSLATNVTWDSLSSLFLKSEYFRNQLNIMSEDVTKIKRDKDRNTLFPKRIDISIGSRIQHNLGMAIVLNIFDEAAFGVVTEQVSKAFQSAIRRIQSRFGSSDDGILKGKILLISSENDKSSEVNSILNQYKNYPGVFISAPAIWDVKKEHYSKEKFKIFIGSDSKQPEIIDLENKYLLDTDSDRIIEAPVSIKREFETNLHEALRDLAGISTSSSYKLFRLRDKISSCCTMTQIFPEVVTLDFDSIENNILFKECLYKDYFRDFFYTNKPRHVHIDIGVVNDYLGLSCSYIPEFYQRKSEELNIETESAANIYEVLIRMNTDFAFACKPISGKRLPLHRIREFLFYLKNEFKYPITSVSCDGFQSEEMLQILNKAGFATKLVSVDKTIMPYVELRTGIYEGRVILPQNDLLKKELFNLEVSMDGKKIDHPQINDDGSKGSKDVSDCVAGCYYFLHTNIADYQRYENILNVPSDLEIAKIQNEINMDFEIEDGISTINDFFKRTLK